MEEAKRRRLHDLASKSDNRAKLSVDDYRSRARDDHDERRALNKLVAARKTMQELDERSGIMSNYLWLDPHEEYARMRAENWGGARFGPKGRLGDFGAVDEADEDAYGFGDDQNRNNTLREGQIDIALEGEEAFESDEIVKMDEQKDEFLQLDARARLAKTTAYLRDKYQCVRYTIGPSREFCMLGIKLISLCFFHQLLPLVWSPVCLSAGARAGMSRRRRGGPLTISCRSNSLPSDFREASVA